MPATRTPIAATARRAPAPTDESGALVFDVPARPLPEPYATEQWIADAENMPRWAALALPFRPELVEVKPGAVSEEKGRCLALAYVDARHYQARLDVVATPAGWSVEYRPLSERAVLCRLTVLGVVREDVGEAESSDPNQATSAAMQAFKRACAAFGLGRYLYTDLPQLWVDAEKRGKNWVIKDPAGVVAQLYDLAGIDLSRKRAYIGRLVTLCEALSEEQLIAVGKCAAAATKREE